MTQLASDDFNRADGGLGTNWIGPLRPTAPEEIMRIISNEAVRNVSGDDASALYDGSITWPSDQYSEGNVIGDGTGGGSGAGTGLIVRGDVPTGVYYRTVAYVSATNSVEVVKFLPAATVLGADINVAWASGDIMRVEASGSTLTIYKNGTSIGTRTDSSITSGKPGIAYSSAANSTAVDNWEGGSLAVAVDVSTINLPLAARISYVG